jgi:hypothetical protein
MMTSLGSAKTPAGSTPSSSHSRPLQAGGVPSSKSLITTCSFSKNNSSSSSSWVT